MVDHIIDLFLHNIPRAQLICLISPAFHKMLTLAHQNHTPQCVAINSDRQHYKKTFKHNNIKEYQIDSQSVIEYQHSYLSLFLL